MTTAEIRKEVNKKNAERREKYIEMLQQLRWLGQEILENDDNYDDFMEEIENMDEHLAICKKILEKANK